MQSKLLVTKMEGYRKFIVYDKVTEKWQWWC